MKTLFQIIQVSVLLLAFAQQTTWAQADSEQNDSSREKFHSALNACSEKYGGPEKGQRPSKEFHECMKAAGFDGPPKHDGGGHSGSCNSEDSERNTASEGNSQQ